MTRAQRQRLPRGWMSLNLTTFYLVGHESTSLLNLCREKQRWCDEFIFQNSTELSFMSFVLQITSLSAIVGWHGYSIWKIAPRTLNWDTRWKKLNALRRQKSDQRVHELKWMPRMLWKSRFRMTTLNTTRMKATTTRELHNYCSWNKKNFHVRSSTESN